MVAYRLPVLAFSSELSWRFQTTMMKLAAIIRLQARARRLGSGRLATRGWTAWGLLSGAVPADASARAGRDRKRTIHTGSQRPARAVGSAAGDGTGRSGAASTAGCSAGSLTLSHRLAHPRRQRLEEMG